MFQTAVGTNHNLKVAWFQHIFQLAVVEFQQVVGNLELHYLAFALLQVNALKALQLFYGAGDAGHHIVDVQLHNLVGIVVAGIGNRYLCCAAVKRYIAISTGGIAQTVAEGVEWGVTYIEVVAAELLELLAILAYRATGG